MICQLGSSFRGASRALLIWFLQTFGVGTGSDPVEPPLAAARHFWSVAIPQKHVRPPNTKVTRSIMSLHYIPDICNPILHFAGGKCHWQREILKRGLCEWRVRRWRACLEIKAAPLCDEASANRTVRSAVWANVYETTNIWFSAALSHCKVWPM